MTRRRRVLQDHQRKGSRFVAPMNQVGPWEDVAWLRSLVPELLWLGLLHQMHGDARAAQVASLVARAAREAVSDESKLLGGISDFALRPEDWTSMRTNLAEDVLADAQEALQPLLHYPMCPLLPVLDASKIGERGEHLGRLKAVLRSVYDRTSREATMMQASFVWLAFDAGRLKVKQGLTLADFPEVERYPETERSREVASSVRSTTKILASIQGLLRSDWSRGFWNRGLELESCEVTR